MHADRERRVAAVQMCSGADVGANLETARRLIAQAATEGARLVVLPENFAIMARSHAERRAAAESDGKGPIQDFLSASAREHEVWLIGGTMPMRGSDPGRVRAASLVYDHTGRRSARYDKIHLFDVRLANGEHYTESAGIEPGEDVVSVETPLGRCGLTVCYDMRFPELYRRLLDDDVRWFSVPAAFTVPTGQAHWATLLRARAIENLAYVVAPAQVGRHADGRRTWGHSMILGPWGEELAVLADGEGVVVADLNDDHQRSVRATFPSPDHRRLAIGPVGPVRPVGPESGHMKTA